MCTDLYASQLCYTLLSFTVHDKKPIFNALKFLNWGKYLNLTHHSSVKLDVIARNLNDLA